MTTNTSGPWAISKHQASRSVQIGTQYFVASTNADYPISLADASLIAAAPELLAVASLFASLADRLEADGYIGDGNVIEIRAAIAKARGE